MSIKTWLCLLALAYAALIGVLVEHRERGESPTVPATERESCVDTPDMRAYMARRPGEPHSSEECIHSMRYGSPNWVPDFMHPLRKEGTSS